MFKVLFFFLAPDDNYLQSHACTLDNTVNKSTTAGRTFIVEGATAEAARVDDTLYLWKQMFSRCNVSNGCFETISWEREG